MPAESGRKIGIGIGLEATRGTSVAPTFYTSHDETDFIEKNEKQLNESGLGVLDKNSAAEISKRFGGGKVGGKVSDKEIGAWLALAFGAKPTSAANADVSGLVFDHTFAQSQSNTPLTGTVAIKDGNRDERFPLASLASFNLSVEAGDWVKWSADLLSKKPTSSAGNTVAYSTTENKLKAKHVTVKLAANVAGLAGATALPLTSLNFTVTRKLKDHLVLGSDDLNNIFTEEVEYSGDFAMLFESMAHRDSFMNNTNQVMQISIQDTDVTIGTAANPKLVITVSRVNFADWGVDQGLGNMVEQTIGLTPLYSQTDAKTWSAVLTNTQASY